MTQKNYVDATGLVTQSREDIVTELTTEFKAIYGDDINVDSNSPDGQQINILAQVKVDMLDTARQVYNSFSPSKAVGKVLDQRIEITGLERDGVTYTIINVSLTLTVIKTLDGQDNAVIPFTVTDSTGNKYYLQTGQTLGAGVHNNVLFISAVPGNVLVTIAGGLTIATPVAGVTAAYSSTPVAQQGQDEERDLALRLRQQSSVSNPAQGWLDAIQGSLKAIVGVTDAKVYENNFRTTTVDGSAIPGNTMWAIVAGGANVDIADVIYRKRNAGCGMKGSVDVAVTQVNDTVIDILFDRPTAVPLYIAITVGGLGNHHADADYLASQIAENFTFGIGQVADYTAIAAFIKTIDPLATITLGGIGATLVDAQSGSEAPVLAPIPTFAGQWTLDVANVHITAL